MPPQGGKKPIPKGGKTFFFYPTWGKQERKSLERVGTKTRVKKKKEKQRLSTGKSGITKEWKISRGSGQNQLSAALFKRRKDHAD